MPLTLDEKQKAKDDLRLALAFPFPWRRYAAEAFWLFQRRR